MKPYEKLKNKPGLAVSVIQNKKIVLGIGMIAVFLFTVFSISSYYKERNSLTCPVFGWSISIFDLIPILVSLGVVVGAATYYTMSFKVEAKEKSFHMLGRFGLQDRTSLYPEQLSGGQRQRVAIAQQLLCSEHFLLMDEPFSGLDPIMKDKVCELITEVASAHELNTIIVVSHDISATISIADTLWLMGRDIGADGKIIPGAKLKYVYDLAEKGLAWHPDIQLMPRFSDLVREVKEKFRIL